MPSQNESLLLEHFIPTDYKEAPLRFIAGYPNVAQLIILAAITVVVFLSQGEKPSDGLPTANKLFRWEPTFMARLRWIYNAQQILAAADMKVCQHLVVRGSLSFPERELMLKNSTGQRSPVPLVQRRYGPDNPLPRTHSRVERPRARPEQSRVSCFRAAGPSHWHGCGPRHKFPRSCSTILYQSSASKPL